VTFKNDQWDKTRLKDMAAQSGKKAGPCYFYEIYRIGIFNQELNVTGFRTGK
jgi:hypothetical protein